MRRGHPIQMPLDPKGQITQKSKSDFRNLLLGKKGCCVSGSFRLVFCVQRQALCRILKALQARVVSKTTGLAPMILTS